MLMLRVVFRAARHLIDGKMISRVENFRQNTRGATMVEFALCLIVFFAMLGGLFDIGMMVRSYNSLDEAVRLTVRGATVRVATSEDCNDARTYVVTVGDQNLASKYNIANASWVGQWFYPAAGVSLKPTLKLQVSTQAKCFFLCNMFPAGAQISASAEADMDYNREVCTDFTA
jgi:Flp pilus assembly protein TadG